MNRTFLLFLMIGTALLILVIGGNPTEDQPAYTPWNISILDNNKIRVFGVTLGKTTIQDANQIFANFPETRLIDNNGKLQLLFCHTKSTFKLLKLSFFSLFCCKQIDSDVLEKMFPISLR